MSPIFVPVVGSGASLGLLPVGGVAGVGVVAVGVEPATTILATLSAGLSSPTTLNSPTPIFGPVIVSRTDRSWIGSWVSGGLLPSLVQRYVMLGTIGAQLL